MCPGDVDEMASSVDPNQFDLGLHCLPRRVCPNTWDKCGMLGRGDLSIRILRIVWIKFI